MPPGQRIRSKLMQAKSRVRSATFRARSKLTSFRPHRGGLRSRRL